MTGPVPQYDADHPPPQWPRFYRPSEKGPEGSKQPATVPGEFPKCPEDIPGALGLDAANQFYDHLGKIGVKLPHTYSEGESSSAFTMSEFAPEKHIYVVQFTWGQHKSLIVDSVGIDEWDTAIEMMDRFRQEMIDTYNVYIWISFVIYPILYKSRQSSPVIYRWETQGFIPEGRSLPTWMEANTSITERNLGGNDIDQAIGSVTSLGGPKLQAGRTAIAIVNSYPTFGFEGIDEPGPFDPSNPSGIVFQGFVPNRNASAAVIGQTDIDQANSTNVAADFSGRGSGNDPGLLGYHPDFYTRFLPRWWLGVSGQPGVWRQLVDDYPGNGPINPTIFPYPLVTKNWWNYWVETYPPGYPGIASIPYSGSPPHKHMSVEGYYENLDISFDETPNILSEVVVAASYDGITGERPAFVVGSFFLGNPGAAGFAHMYSAVLPIINPNFVPQYAGDTQDRMDYLNSLSRDHWHCAMQAAQIVWTDHMGGPPADFRGWGVINLTGVAAGTHVDYDSRDNADDGGGAAIGQPPNEGVTVRPVAVLEWGSNWPIVADPDEQDNPAVSSGGFNPDRMPLWEIRWAFDEQTLLDGGGVSINYHALTTGNRPGTGSYPTSGSTVAVSHGRVEATLIWFTVLEWDILER